MLAAVGGLLGMATGAGRHLVVERKALTEQALAAFGRGREAWLLGGCFVSVNLADLLGRFGVTGDADQQQA